MRSIGRAAPRGVWRLAFATGLVGLLVAASAVANAQQAAPNPPPETETSARLPWREAMERAPAPEEPDPANMVRSWYGWQTLGIDALSVGVGVATEGEILLASLIGLGLGAPLVHIAHANYTRAFISFGVRGACIGLFILGIVALFDDSFDDDGGSETKETLGTVLTIGSFTGMLVMIGVDAAALAFEEKPKPVRMGFAPLLDPRRGSYGVRFALAL